MIDHDDLLRRIRLDEDPDLETGRVSAKGAEVMAPRRGDLADVLAGMANGRGGTLVLGVDGESRDIVGVPEGSLGPIGCRVSSICSDYIDPPLDALVRKIQLPDTRGTLQPILYVDVPKSVFVHQSPGGYLRRTGGSNRRLSQEGLARLFEERSFSRVIRFDRSIVPRTAVDILDSVLVGRFLRHNVGMTEDVLCNIRIIGSDVKGDIGITVAGVLMCARSPGYWMPHAYIQAVNYAGEQKDGNHPLNALDISGPLDVQVMEALHFVRRNMFVRAVKEAGRREIPQYSERAVFEALVNAVAHRDYSMAGARIRLHMFKDRLELYVPGGLTNTLTTEGMQYRQHCRNELIVSLLARCPVDDEAIGRNFMMERRGDGVPIILEESLALSGRRPEYTLIDDSELRLVIWAANPEWAEEARR